MPIFKRYYIADIPGMAWTADFYLTHAIHYLGAIFLAAFLTYVSLDYFLSGRTRYSLTATAYVRILILAGLVTTGVFRVLKNMPDIVFSPAFTLLIDVTHLGFMICYPAAALVFLVMKSGWVEERA